MYINLSTALIKYTCWIAVRWIFEFLSIEIKNNYVRKLSLNSSLGDELSGGVD